MTRPPTRCQGVESGGRPRCYEWSDPPEPEPLLKVSDDEYWCGDYKIEPATGEDSYHFKWSFLHTDYDGAPDAKDNRQGFGHTVAECHEEIHQIEMLNEDEGRL